MMFSSWFGSKSRSRRCCFWIKIFVLLLQCLWIYYLAFLFRQHDYIRTRWINTKKWWYKRIVLQEFDLDTGPDVVYNASFSDVNIPDFDYQYPQPDSFSFIWTVMDRMELCSALVAMNRLKSFYDDSNNVSKIQPMYVLVYSGLDEDEEYLLDKWHQKGGKSIQPSQELPDDLIKIESFLKYRATQVGFTWVLLMDSNGIPLPKISNLFVQASQYKINANAMFAAYMANDMELKQLKRILNKRKKCLGAETPIINSKLLLFQPNTHLGTRILTYLKNPRNSYRFHEILNYEFGCNDETFVIHDNQIAADYEFSQIHGRRAALLKDSIFVYFGLKTKPWDIKYQSTILPMLSKEMRDLIQDWKKDVKLFCGLDYTFEQTSEENRIDSNYPKFFQRQRH